RACASASGELQSKVGCLAHDRNGVSRCREMAAAKSKASELSVGERPVRISNPDRVCCSARGEAKLDLARYYMSVGDGIVRALRERPCMLHRFPSGVDGEKVHQKRLPR